MLLTNQNTNNCSCYGNHGCNRWQPKRMAHFGVYDILTSYRDRMILVANLPTDSLEMLLSIKLPKGIKC